MTYSPPFSPISKFRTIFLNISLSWTPITLPISKNKNPLVMTSPHHAHASQHTSKSEAHPRWRKSCLFNLNNIQGFYDHIVSYILVIKGRLVRLYVYWKFSKKVELKCSLKKKGTYEVRYMLTNSVGDSFHKVYVYQIILYTLN